MAGVQIDGVNNKIDFDDDLDTSISANTDDTLVFEVGAATVASWTSTVATFNDSVVITTADNTDTLTLTSTDADANAGPILKLNRNSSSPADSDDIGKILFTGENDASESIDYATIRGDLLDVTDGTEDGIIKVETIVAGTNTEIARFGNGVGVVFNEDSNDLDFRVESNGNANMLFVEGETDRVGIGTNDPDMILDVTGTVSAGGGSDENLQQWNIASDNVKASMEYVDDSGTRGMRLAVDSAHALHLGTEGSSNIYIQAGGQTWINRTTSNQNDHDSGKVERLGVTETSGVRNSLYLSNTASDFGSYHQRNDATRAANVTYGFFIGSSGNESDNEIRMMGDGSINSDGSNNLGSGADYAEYFEWKDGNSSDEDRRGYSVVLDGNQIVKATDSDDASKIIGVISGNPSVVGDSAWNKWNQKHLKDDFNTYIWEDYTQTEWTDADGNFISHQTDLIPNDVTVPDDAVVVSKEEDGTTNLQRRKVNPSWDATATYIPRSDRKEWDTVGLMGKLRLKKGQPTGTNWIKMRDISDSVEEWLVR